MPPVLRRPPRCQVPPGCPPWSSRTGPGECVSATQIWLFFFPIFFFPCPWYSVGVAWGSVGPAPTADKSLDQGLTFNRSQRGSCSATYETLTQNQVVCK